jgi:hypothetical protein
MIRMAITLFIINKSIIINIIINIIIIIIITVNTIIIIIRIVAITSVIVYTSIIPRFSEKLVPLLPSSWKAIEGVWV